MAIKINGSTVIADNQAFTTTSTVSATGNITGGNLVTTGTVSAATIIGNVQSTGPISTTGNVTGGNILTGGLISSAGNITTAGNISATGNIEAFRVHVGNGGIGTPVGISTFFIANVNPTNIQMGGDATTINIGNAAGNTTFAGNVLVGKQISATGNITGGNLLTGGLISATSIITSAANITGGNLLTGGLISATGAITGAALTGTSLTVSTGNITGGNLLLSGAIQDSGQLDIQTTASNGNIVLTPNGTGNVNIGSNVMPTANATANIGSATLQFNTIFARATSAQYADLAEKYTADAEYAPGTVVMFGGSDEVTLCVADGCSRVAGVISTNPSYIMNGTLEAAHVATVALTGRVPCKVQGYCTQGRLDGVSRKRLGPCRRQSTCGYCDW
jgi:hypothetical protein